MHDTSALTLEQKAALGSGSDFFSTKALAGVPSITASDGPHGLRKQRSGGDHLGIMQSVPATCFPPECGLGQSWSTALAHRVGAALGQECRAEDVQLLLGPGLNLKRSPLGGRSFEYFAEDPVLTAALGTAWVQGLQSEGVGASPKHFIANEQETDRQRASSDLDARTLHEVYLRAFERVVQEAKPWTVMASYNRVNGEYAAESRQLLHQVLREEWGFEGVVVSDWGGVVDRVASTAAGLDLEMPSSGGVGDRALVEAVRSKQLPETAVDDAAARVAALASLGAATAPLDGYDVDAHHELAREAARSSITLLKNDGGLLPLRRESDIAVIGAYAKTPRYQGGGSSRTEPTRLDVPLDEITRLGAEVQYAPGYGDAAGSTLLRDEAVRIAGAADVAVVFLALPEEAESEGWDRETLDLPADQIELAHAVHAANPNTVAVISRGGVVLLEPLTDLPALVDTALLGQGGGRAIAEVLFGEVNPSGHITEAVPTRLEDTPAFLNFPGEQGHVRYAEGVFVGQRWYDAHQLRVTFPFGHGLSYTTFEFDRLQVAAEEGGIRATVAVTNTGDRTGRAVAQFYVSVAGSVVQRPARELKGFADVEVAPGERAVVSALLRRQDLAYWDVQLDRFILEPAEYIVAVGRSAADLVASASVALPGDKISRLFTLESTLGELLQDPTGAAIVGQMLSAMLSAGAGADVEPEASTDIVKVMASFPLNRMISFSAGAASAEQLQQLVDAVNAARSVDAPAHEPDAV